MAAKPTEQGEGAACLGFGFLSFLVFVTFRSKGEGPSLLFPYQTHKQTKTQKQHQENFGKCMEKRLPQTQCPKSAQLRGLQALSTGSRVSAELRSWGRNSVAFILFLCPRSLGGISQGAPGLLIIGVKGCRVCLPPGGSPPIAPSPSPIHPMPHIFAYRPITARGQGTGKLWTSRWTFLSLSLSESKLGDRRVPSSWAGLLCR